MNLFVPFPRARTAQSFGGEWKTIDVNGNPLRNRAAKIWTRAMGDIRSIVARFPQREFDIRRRCARDPRFRAICADYEEAARALSYWQKIAQEGDRTNEADRKVEEYTSFLGELESEILAHLDRSILNGQQA